MRVEIRPSVIGGHIRAPQSKSIAIRLILSSLAGNIVMEGLERSGDVDAALSAVERLGVVKRGNTLSPGKVPQDAGTIDFGGSGTTLRMALPLLSLLGTEAVLDGDATLRRRPIGVLVEWLNRNGMDISSDRLPMRIRGRIDTDCVEISGSESSQYISGFILGLHLRGGGRIRLIPPVVSRSYIQMTCAVLSSIGATTAIDGDTISVDPATGKLEFHGSVPGDFLLSSFYAIAAAITGGSLSISGLSRPEWSSGDARIVDLLAGTGSGSRLQDGTWSVEAGEQILPFTEDVSDSPDMSVSLSALASFSSGTSIITGIEGLRTKESDRMASITGTLSAFGVGSRGNGRLEIDGCRNPVRGTVKSWKDHRITMLGTLLALRPGGTVEGAEDVDKSNPRFFSDLAELGGRIIHEH